MPRCDKHQARALVHRSRRRQGERSADRVPNHPRYARGTRHDLSGNEPGTPAGIAVDPQAAREMRSAVPGCKRPRTVARTMGALLPSRSWREIVAPYARADQRRAVAQLLKTGLPFLIVMLSLLCGARRPSRIDAPARRPGGLIAGPPVCDPA